MVKRAAITVTAKQPYIDWANGLDEDGVKIGEEFEPEKSVYLIGAVTDVIPFDRDVIVQPYFKAIFDESVGNVIDFALNQQQNAMASTTTPSRANRSHSVIHRHIN